MDFSDYTDEELQRLANQSRLDEFTDEELEETVRRAMPPQGGSFADPLGQGLTFGLSDEIAGAAGAALGTVLPESMGGLPGFNAVEHYKGIRDAARANEQAFAERNPGTALGLEMGGAMLSGGGLGSAMAKGGPRLAELAKIGAVEGGLYGFGEGEGLQGSVGSAALGAPVGAVAGAAGLPLEKGMDFLARQASPQKWMAPIKRAVDNSGGLDEVQQRLANAHPDAVLGDMTPELQQLTAGTANRAGGRDQIQDFMLDRQMKMTGQIDDAGAQLSDTPYYQRMDELGQQQATKAEFNYNMVKDEPIQITNDMARIMATDPGLDAVKAATNKLRLEFRMDELPEEMYSTVRFIDEVKKSLYGKEQKAIRAGDNHTASLLGDMRRELVGEVDSQTGGLYKTARDEYAKPARIMDAMEEGRGMFGTKQDPMEFIAGLQGRDPDEIDAMLVGVVREMNKRAGDKPATADSAWGTVRSPNFRSKLGAVVGDDSVTNRFLDTMGQLSDMNATYRLSNTGSRTNVLREVQDEMDEGVGMVGRALSGDPTAILGAVQQTLQKQLSHLDDRQISRIAEELLSRGISLEEIMQQGEAYRAIIPSILNTMQSFDRAQQEGGYLRVN